MMTKLLHYAIFVLMAFFVWAVLMPSANAAVTWTQQPNEFFWYKAGTQNKYLFTTDIDVPASYVKQPGTFIQCKSTGGANKYWQQGYDCYGKQTAPQPPIVTYCDVQFVCHENWGWIVDLSQLKTDGCNHVKITKEQALFYEGKRNVDGSVTCPIWPKP